jgi:two-component system, LytTR family, response regulator
VIRALIVDDEPLARRRVRELLADEADFTVAGECEDGFDAATRIPEMRPDVVYLDVQMPGLSGFELLQELEPPLPAIVFITAYESYAIRAFEANALDYLLKPLDAARFHDSTQRVRATLAGNRMEWSERIAALLARLQKRDETLRRIAVKSGGRIVFVDVRDVDWFESAGNYVSVHTGGASHLIRMTMQTLDARLDRRTFARIHRGAIVNTRRIAELEAHARGRFKVVLKSGAKLDMQRNYHDRLRAVLGDF